MPDIHIITVDGHRMAGVTINASQPGVPIVLIHGVVDSIYFWQRGPAAPFLPYGPCTSLSLPGHYPAVFPPHLRPEELTAEVIARLTMESIRQMVGDQPVLLVGHSTGAFAALATAAAYPEIARGVISIAGFAVGRWSGFLSVAQWVASHDWVGKDAFRRLFALGSRPAFFNLTAGLHTPDASSGTANQTMPSPARTSYQAFCDLSPEAMRLYFSAMRQIDIRAWLGRIRVPTLLIFGSRDLAVPSAQSRLIAASIPNVEAHRIAGSGHLPFFDHPHEYRQIVQSWLQRQFPPGNQA